MAAAKIPQSAQISALEEATAFIQRGLDAGTWSQVNRLPTLPELARDAGVSKMTMAKAVHVFVQLGKLRARRRQGITVVRDSRLPLSTVTKGSKTDSVAGELVRHLLAGTYGPTHELPSMKELQAHYGVCFRTMKRSLDALVEEGVLSVGQRGYRLRTPAPGLSSNALVVIMGREMERVLETKRYAQSFYYPLLYGLERNCSRRNLRLDLERFPEFPSRFSRNRDAVGYFVVLDTDPEKETIELISRLVSFDLPVIVFRETDHPTFSLLPPKPHLVFVECSSDIAAFEVGQLLLSQGHRRAAYLTHTPEAGWSKDRHRGLVRAFRLAGLSNAVTAYTTPMTGLVPEALEKSDVTAWVACDDILATEVLIPNLRARGVTPGSGVSVIGFNDQLDAFQHRLTSYNFNTDALASAVLFHVQFPERRLKRVPPKKHEPVLLGGYVVDRGSVGKAPRSARERQRGRALYSSGVSPTARLKTR